MNIATELLTTLEKQGIEIYPVARGGFGCPISMKEFTSSSTHQICVGVREITDLTAVAYQLVKGILSIQAETPKRIAFGILPEFDNMCFVQSGNVVVRVSDAVEGGACITCYKDSGEPKVFLTRFDILIKIWR